MSPRLAASAALLLACCLLLEGCTHRAASAPVPPPVEDEPGYLDLQSGWRVRVMVPILRSGGHVTPLTMTTGNNALSAKVGDDYLGYELDYYSVKSRPGQGISIAFHRATASMPAKQEKRDRPILPLFNFPENIRFVRLLHLVRESDSDHDIVLLGASNAAALSKLTGDFALHAPRACAASPDVLCSLVPQGVAVVPEKRMKVEGKMQWQPVK